jgi:SAM-dependent methyltransferase
VKRLCSPEITDDPALPDDVLDGVHRDLTRIHRWLGNTGAIIAALRRDPAPVRRVLDIGCGHGGVLVAIRRALGADVIGVDLRTRADDSPIPVIRADALRSPLPESDVAISLCLAHHLSEPDVGELILNASRSCRRFILLDLVRHSLPLFLFRAAVAPFVGRVTSLDGVHSIRRAYTPKELGVIVRHALRGTTARFRHTVAPFYVRQMVDITFYDGKTMWPGVRPRSRQKSR